MDFSFDALAEFSEQDCFGPLLELEMTFRLWRFSSMINGEEIIEFDYSMSKYFEFEVSMQSFLNHKYNREVGEDQAWTGMSVSSIDGSSSFEIIYGQGRSVSRTAHVNLLLSH